jgi:hypothetical protein
VGVIQDAELAGRAATAVELADRHHCGAGRARLVEAGLTRQHQGKPTRLVEYPAHVRCEPDGGIALLGRQRELSCDHREHPVGVKAPPRQAEEMEGHWRRFRAMAAFRAPEGIDAFTDRTLAVRADSAGNWRAVHADRRSDWAYALAMSHLAEEILQAAPGSPAPTTHQAGHD